MAAHGCMWLRVAACGCTWLHVAARGCMWLRVAACGCTCLLVAACGCMWLHVAARGCVWLRVAAARALPRCRDPACHPPRSGRLQSGSPHGAVFERRERHCMAVNDSVAFEFEPPALRNALIKHWWLTRRLASWCTLCSAWTAAGIPPMPLYSCALVPLVTGAPVPLCPNVPMPLRPRVPFLKVHGLQMSSYADVALSWLQPVQSPLPSSTALSSSLLACLPACLPVCLPACSAVRQWRAGDVSGGGAAVERTAHKVRGEGRRRVACSPCLPCCRAACSPCLPCCRVACPP